MLFGRLLLDVGSDGGLDLGVVILGVHDLDAVGHDLTVFTVANFDTLHDLDFKPKNTLAQFNVTDSDINEIELGLTGRDLVTSSILLGLCTLSTDFTGYHYFTTGGSTSAHNCSNDVVGCVTYGDSVKQLVLKGLDVGGGRQVLVVGKRLDGKLHFVVLIVEVVALLN